MLQSSGNFTLLAGSTHPGPDPHSPAPLSHPPGQTLVLLKQKVEFQVLPMLPAEAKGCVSHPFSRTMELCLKKKKIPTEDLGSKMLGNATFLERETISGVDMKNTFFTQTSKQPDYSSELELLTFINNEEEVNEGLV